MERRNEAVEQAEQDIEAGIETYKLMVDTGLRGLYDLTDSEYVLAYVISIGEAMQRELSE